MTDNLIDARGEDMTAAGEHKADQAPEDIPPSLSRGAPLGDRRAVLQGRIGQLVLAAMRLPRYQRLSVAQLRQVFLAPLLADRIAFAGDDGDGAGSTAGIAIWASVSDSVAERIAGQAETDAFPIVLTEEEWQSGENIWLLDLLVPSRRAGTALFTSFSGQIGSKGFRMHPVVAQSLGADMIDSFREAIAGAQAKGPVTPAQGGQ